MYQKYLNILKYITLTLLIAMTLTGCSRNLTGIPGRSPIAMDDPHASIVPVRTYVRGLPTGSDSYSQGFRAGCQTGFSISGVGTMRLIETKIDGYKLSDDKMYQRGYADGADYCQDRLDWESH